jgi:sugar lactone lactonase YvrE
MPRAADFRNVLVRPLIARTKRSIVAVMWSVALAIGSSAAFGDDGNSIATATLIQPNTSRVAEIETPGDNDFFRIDVPSAGRLTVSTTGPTDTYGYLLDGNGQELLSNDDTFDLNFIIARFVTAGTYYVRVRHYSEVGTGPYTLQTSLRALAATGTVTTFAGGGIPRPLPPPSGPATAAALYYPSGVAVDSAGVLYIQSGASLLKVVAGTVSTVLADAGIPSGIAVAANGDLYFSDLASHQVKKVDTAGTVTIIAGNGTVGYGGDGGPATGASLNAPGGIALDGTALLVADTNNLRVRRISGGIITTVAGTGDFSASGDGGPATSAALLYPVGIALDGSGGFLVVEASGGRVRRVDNAGVITTFAGGGASFPDGVAATSAYLSSPRWVARDASGNVYISLAYENNVVVVNAAGQLSRLAGNGSFGFSGDNGPARDAAVAGPMGVATTPGGVVYIADSENQRIRKVDASRVITTVAGNGMQSPLIIGDGGSSSGAFLNHPIGVSVDSAGRTLIAEFDGQRVRRVDTTGTISTLAGTGVAGFSGDGGPAASAQLDNPPRAIEGAGSAVLIADYRNGRIRSVDAGGVITTLRSGEGSPSYITRDGAGNYYVVYQADNVIRKITGGSIQTVVGNGSPLYGGDGGPATQAGIQPNYAVVDPAGNLFISTHDHRVRKVDTAGIITTIAGTGLPTSTGDGGPAIAASLSGPSGLALDPSGNLYINEYYGNRIRMVSPDGTIDTVAGTGFPGFGGDGGPAGLAQFNSLEDLVWHNGASALLAADLQNMRVRRFEVVDTTPAQFSFAPAVGVTPSSLVQSPTVTPVAYAAPTAISIAGGEYSIGCAGAFTTAAGTISPGQSVCVRHVASGLANGEVATALTIGGVRGVFTSTTPPVAGSLGSSPAALDFGVRLVGARSVPLTLALTNTGSTTVQVHLISASGPFAVSHACVSLAPGVRCDARVTITPPATGLYSGTLTVRASFGSLSVPLAGTGETASTGLVVDHYYRTILGRSPDAGGRAFWQAEAARVQALGGNVEEVFFAMAVAFLSSQEYLARNRDDAGYLTDLYQAFFQRDPDASGLAFWQGLLASGLQREVVVASFLFSPEFFAFVSGVPGNHNARAEVYSVMDFYRGLLSRLPDDAGFNFWVGRFRAAQCQGPTAVNAQVEAISSQFATSGEYIGRNRTNAQYVGDLYNAFLRRGGDLGGVQFWVSAISRTSPPPITREQLRVEFMNSPEFQARVQAMIAQGCLN